MKRVNILNVFSKYGKRAIVIIPEINPANTISPDFKAAPNVSTCENALNKRNSVIFNIESWIPTAINPALVFTFLTRYAPNDKEATYTTRNIRS